MEVPGRRKQKGSNNHTTAILCDPCKRVNEEENAKFYCTACIEFLCDADARAHRKSAMSTTHRLLDRKNMPSQKIGTYEDNICSIHKGEILKCYCNSHNKSCCSKCTTKEHTQCKDEYIDDIAKGYEESKEYKSLIKDMTNLTQRLRSAMKYSSDNKSNAQHLHYGIVSEIRKFRVEINSMLDSLENASLKEVKETLHVDSDAAESTATNCDTFLAKLEEMASSIENLKEYKPERQLVIHSKNARSQVKAIEDEFSKLSDLNIRNDYKFIPDKTIPELLQSLKSLGRLEITKEIPKPEKTSKEQESIKVSKYWYPSLTSPLQQVISSIPIPNIRRTLNPSNGSWWWRAGK